MRIYLLLAFCLPAFAQTTTVTGTIRDPAGDPLSGACSVQAVGPFTAASGWRVIGAPTVVRFSGGAFTFALAPTDSATPAGQYYKVTCSVPQQTVNGRSVGPFSWGPRYWLVPTNANSLDIGTVEISSPPPSPSWVVNWSQLAQNGAQVGQSPVWSGTSWQPVYVSGAGALSSVFGRTGVVTAQMGDYTAAQVTNAVDQTGNYSNPTWIASLAWNKLTGLPSTFNAGQIQGRVVASSGPSDLQYLGWNNAASQWEPKTIPAAPVLSLFGRTGAVVAQSGDYAFSQIGGTVTGSQLPAAGGDLAGNLTAATVAKIQGNAVAAGTPADGQMMQWSANASQWKPVVVRFGYSFSSQTIVTIPGSTHAMGTADLLVTCVDTSSPPQIVEPSAVQIDASTYDVTIIFAAPQSGRCVLR